MLTIRFSRVGKRNHAQFQITLQEHTVAPGGRHIEILGSYDPHRKKAVLKREKIEYWISKGATLSDTVHNLLISEGIVKGEKRKVKLPKKIEAPKAEEAKEIKKDEAKTEEPKEEAKAEEKPAEEVKSEEVKADEAK